MEIENNLFSVSNALIKDKEKWKYVSDDQKESFFFIINRYIIK